MDRRLSHWQCTFCRHENPLSEQADVCGKCNGARQQLGDSDAVAREEARRSARSREAHGRALNSRGEDAGSGSLNATADGGALPAVAESAEPDAH